MKHGIGLAQPYRVDGDTVHPVKNTTWFSVYQHLVFGPLNVDLSDYSDDYVAGFVAGQVSLAQEIEACRFTLPWANFDDDGPIPPLPP